VKDNTEIYFECQGVFYALGNYGKVKKRDSKSPFPCGSVGSIPTSGTNEINGLQIFKKSGPTKFLLDMQDVLSYHPTIGRNIHFIQSFNNQL